MNVFVPLIVARFRCRRPTSSLATNKDELAEGQGNRYSESGDPPGIAIARLGEPTPGESWTFSGGPWRVRGGRIADSSISTMV